MRLWKFDVTPLPGGADAYRACVDDAGRIRRNSLASGELLLRQPDGAQPARLISQLAGLNRHLERLPHFKRFKMPRQERVELSCSLIPPPISTTPGSNIEITL